MAVTPPPPSPARDAQAVADRAAKAIESFSQWFGPYPYGSLALTQMPGNLSQGWPGLVFLSSFAFLSPQEQTDLRLDPVARELDSQVLVHETAHQWWGDLVLGRVIAISGLRRAWPTMPRSCCWSSTTPRNSARFWKSIAAIFSARTKMESGCATPDR